MRSASLINKAGPSSKVNNAKELSMPLCDSQHQDNEHNLGAIITGAVNSKPAGIMAEIISTHCPSVFLALKLKIENCRGAGQHSLSEALETFTRLCFV